MMDREGDKEMQLGKEKTKGEGQRSSPNYISQLISFQGVRSRCFLIFQM